MTLRGFIKGFLLSFEFCETCLGDNFLFKADLDCFASVYGAGLASLFGEKALVFCYSVEFFSKVMFFGSDSALFSVVFLFNTIFVFVFNYY